MSTDYGLTGGIVARANEMQRIAEEAAIKAKAAAEREQERLEAMRGPSPAEHHAAREREAREKQEREAAEAARHVRLALKRRYIAAAPGVTDEQFERAYPALLEEHRKRVALGGSAEIEEPAGSFADPKLWGL